MARPARFLGYSLPVNTEVPRDVGLEFMHQATIAATLVVLLCMPAAAYGDCMPATLQAFLVTPATAAVPANRPLLVGVRQNYDTGVRTPGPDFPVLSLRRGARTIPLRVEPIAPMLARYVPTRQPPPGEYELVGLGVRLRFGPASTPNVSPPVRPSVRAVQRRARTDSYGSSSLALRIVLSAPLPRGAVALIVRGPGGAVFGQAALTQGQLEHTIFSDEDCEQTLQGRVDPPALGARVEVSFVSATGEIGSPRQIDVTEG
ncbi:MAG: hypothetical protein ACI9KE_005530 [Polyangiales bacterium]|jgi:hypothetical protein